MARDEAFSEFIEASGKATKYTLKANAARAKYMLAASEVRALERDVLAFPVVPVLSVGNYKVTKFVITPL